MVIIWRLDDDEGEEERRLIDLRLASPQEKQLTSSEAISRHACLCVGFGALQDEGKIISSWQARANPPHARWCSHSLVIVISRGAFIDYVFTDREAKIDKQWGLWNEKVDRVHEYTQFSL